MAVKGDKTELRWLGHSSDHRTNRWEATCPACGRKWEPRTTMCAGTSCQCPKCGVALLLEYNKTPAVAVIL